MRLFDEGDVRAELGVKVIHFAVSQRDGIAQRSPVTPEVGLALGTGIILGASAGEMMTPPALSG